MDVEEVRIKTLNIAEKIKNIGEMDEIRPSITELPMITDVCREMYRRVEANKPITAVVNGIRIIMYEI